MTEINLAEKMKSAVMKLSNKKSEISPDISEKIFLDWLGVKEVSKDALSEATYFACLKKLSETMGKLPIHLYQNTPDGVVKHSRNKILRLLKTRPNPHMTPTVFWSTVEMNRNHYGNAYVYIRFDKTEVESLWIIPSEDVDVLIDNDGIFQNKNAIWYQYNDRLTGKVFVFHPDDVLHFKTSTTFNGIIGMSVQDTLRMMLEGNIEAQNFMHNLYKGGLTAKAVVQYSSDLDKEKRQKLIKGLSEFASGSKNAGKMIPVPLGMQVQPLNVKLTDAQFIELKKYSALQIASAFGIKPNQINDYEKSSYNNSESQNLAFYTDTALYIVKQYEEEKTYKLLASKMIDEGYFFKLNVSVILRADSETQAKTLTSYVQNGILKPNEARALLDYTDDDNGNQLMANGNYIPLADIGKQYERGGD